jgi:ElaB/YqjD/DUF883 family membrane-anchored ribosome-binding protein
MATNNPNVNTSANTIPTGGQPNAGNPTDLKSTAQQTAQNVQQNIQQTTQQATQTMQQQLHTQANAQLHTASQGLDQFAQVVRDFSQDLRQRNQDNIAQLSDRAAIQIEHVSDYLHRDINEIVDDVSDYARRQPAVVVIGALALGFLGARFLKSSSQGQRNGTYRAARYGTNATSGRTAPLPPTYTQPDYVPPLTGATGPTTQTGYVPPPTPPTNTVPPTRTTPPTRTGR